jgi:hypothetical protein
MAAVDDVVELIEQFHLAQGEFVSRDRSDLTDKEYVEIAADIFLSGLRAGR